jgi:hypothetical protein
MIENFTVARLDGDKPSVKATKPRRPYRTALNSRDRWLIQTLNNITFRCTNPKDKRYKDYGGRGIKTFLTLEDLQFLYERDRPDLMSRPSVDRKENDDHYTRDNCQFLEMEDNRAKAKRRPYPCEECGAVELPKYFDDKKLCASCSEAARFAAAKYPEYARFVIREATNLGFVVRPIFNNEGKGSQVLIQSLRINDQIINIHYSKKTSSTGSYRKYWKFTPSTTEEFNVLVAKFRKEYLGWVLIGKPASPALYIPASHRDYTHGPKPLHDWPSLKNAWHLLAPVQEEKVA